MKRFYLIVMPILETLKALIGPTIITVTIIVIILYVVSYLRRIFEYLKIKESKFLSPDAINYLELIVFYTIFMLVTVVIVFLYSHVSSLFRTYTVEIIYPYLPMFFSILLVMLFSLFFLGINTRVFQYLRGSLSLKPKRIISEKVGYYTEVIIKYTIYIVALVLILLIIFSGFNLLGDVQAKTYLFFYNNIGGWIWIIIIISLGIVAYLLTSAFIRDIKLRSKVEKEKLGRYLTSIAKYVIFTFVFLAVLMIILSMLGFTYADIFIFTVFVLIFVISSIFIIFTPLRNMFAGIVILSTEPFLEDDYIVIDENIEGRVLNITLLYTQIKQPDGKIVLIPNTKILESKIRIVSSSGLSIPVTMEIKIPSKYKIDFVEKVFHEITSEIDELFQSGSRPSLVLEEISGDYDIYRINFQIDDINSIENVKAKIMKKLKEKLSMEEH